nr:hypothetical protein [Herbihabitans rhizosphaerae]
MAGRHRKPPKKLIDWKVPAGLGVTVAAGLAVTVSLTSGSELPTQDTAARIAVEPGPTVPPTTAELPVTTQVPIPTTAPVPMVAPPPSSTTTTRVPTTTTTPPKPSPRPRTAGKACGTTLDGVQSHVAQVGNHIATMFGVDDIGGRAARGGASDHPSGLALDFMVDTAKGNLIANYILANQKAFGVTYVIWRQRYNDGSGWSTMEDRGGATANHFDHVHVSFRSGAKVSVTC